MATLGHERPFASGATIPGVASSTISGRKKNTTSTNLIVPPCLVAQQVHFTISIFSRVGGGLSLQFPATFSKARDRLVLVNFG